MTPFVSKVVNTNILLKKSTFSNCFIKTLGKKTLQKIPLRNLSLNLKF